ncbi:MAG: hypothetical protein IJB82_02900 [Bacilli bacterium]|nr:hypothetical protein [Bacilli bacterium]
MNKERILNIINYYNLKLSDEDVNRIIEEFKDVNVEENTLNQMILSRIKKIMDEPITAIKLNDFIEYTIGKTSLNFYLNKNTLTFLINKISREFKDEKIAYETYYNYLKNFFIEALVLAVSVVVSNENINKVSVNDTFIQNHMNLFDELGFIIKVLEDDELEMLFPEKTIEERNKLKYYAYIPKEKYLGIYAN